MSGDALLATPARPLYEPSHRPPKKRSARSHSFCSDNTVTDDQQAASVHSGPPIFCNLGLIAAVTACPTPSGHKVRRIATDIRIGSNAVLAAPKSDVRSSAPKADIPRRGVELSSEGYVNRRLFAGLIDFQDLSCGVNVQPEEHHGSQFVLKRKCL
jgi:hypothetical protein